MGTKCTPPAQVDSPLVPAQKHSNNFFQKYIEEFQPEVQVGSPVSENLTEAVEMFSSKSLCPEKIKDRQNLMTMLTNKSIFTLDCGDISFARVTDIKLQKVQKQVKVATYPIICAMDFLKNLYLESPQPQAK